MKNINDISRNQRNVEVILEKLAIIEKSGVSNKANGADYSRLLAPLVERVNELSFVEGYPDDVEKPTSSVKPLTFSAPAEVQQAMEDFTLEELSDIQVKLAAVMDNRIYEGE